MVRGRGKLGGPQGIDGTRDVIVTAADGTEQILTADAVLIATGGHPREIPDAMPDGERILNWTQVYDLDELPEELIVVGSGVTGAEFARRVPGPRLPGDPRVLPRPGAAR